MMIASTAITEGLPLYTTNPGDFAPGQPHPDRSGQSAIRPARTVNPLMSRA